MPNTQPLNIILLGDPAAGKATQAQILMKKYKLVDFDMGKELRKLRRKDKNLDEILKGNTDKGNLTPTQICQNIFKEKISTTPKSKGILFDGTPKMLVEAKLVHKLLKQNGRRDPIVIYLHIPISETVKRMTNRVEYFKGKYSKRADDSAAALKNRVAYYRKNVSAVVKFFRAKYKYHQVSGLGSVEEVKERVAKIVGAV